MMATVADVIAIEFPSWKPPVVTMGGRIWSTERRYRDGSRRWIIAGSGPELLALMRERIDPADR